MRLAPSIALAALLLPPGPTRGAPSSPMTVNGIAVKVNATVITFQEIDDELDDNSLRLLRLRYDRQPEAFQQQVEKLKRDKVQLLVERQLILDEFKTAGYKMTESYVDEEVKRRIRNQFGDRVRMIKSLEHEGVSYEAFRQRLREDFIVHAMEYKNIGSEKIIVSPHKIETYYAQNPDKFKVEDEVKLRMIFLANKPDRDAEATKQKAREVLAEIKGGADFAEKARSHSDGSQGSEGGLWPPVDRKTLREDLAKVAFSLKPGETSDVLERDDGCYLMKVEEFHAAHIKALNEVRPEIEKTLDTEERQRLRKDWIERLKTKAFISYFPTI
ncbi:MAG TPA: peptidyl-prolyl cis-trans isomerase [Haliangiales bacterium]|nr:peptidyl-prolyl cis-trans isomerase [Haliangiales bacterium]